MGGRIRFPTPQPPASSVLCAAPAARPTACGGEGDPSAKPSKSSTMIAKVMVWAGPLPPASSQNQVSPANILTLGLPSLTTTTHSGVHSEHGTFTEPFCSGKPSHLVTPHKCPPTIAPTVTMTEYGVTPTKSHDHTADNVVLLLTSMPMGHLHATAWPVPSLWSAQSTAQFTALMFSPHSSNTSKNSWEKSHLFLCKTGPAPTLLIPPKSGSATTTSISSRERSGLVTHPTSTLLRGFGMCYSAQLPHQVTSGSQKEHCECELGSGSGESRWNSAGRHKMGWLSEWTNCTLQIIGKSIIDNNVSIIPTVFLHYTPCFVGWEVSPECKFLPGHSRWATLYRGAANNKHKNLQL